MSVQWICVPVLFQRYTTKMGGQFSDLFINGSLVRCGFCFCALSPRNKKKSKIKSHSIHLTVRCNAEQSRAEKRITWTTTTDRQATSHWITVKVFGWSNKYAWFVAVLWHCIHNAQHTHSPEIARTFNGQFINLCMRKNRKFGLRRKRKSFHLDARVKSACIIIIMMTEVLCTLYFLSFSLHSLVFIIVGIFQWPELVHQYTF